MVPHAAKWSCRRLYSVDTCALLPAQILEMTFSFKAKKQNNKKQTNKRPKKKQPKNPWIFKERTVGKCAIAGNGWPGFPSTWILGPVAYLACLSFLLALTRGLHTISVSFFLCFQVLCPGPTLVYTCPHSLSHSPHICPDQMASPASTWFGLATWRVKWAPTPGILHVAATYPALCYVPRRLVLTDLIPLSLPFSAWIWDLQVLESECLRPPCSYVTWNFGWWHFFLLSQFHGMDRGQTGLCFFIAFYPLLLSPCLASLLWDKTETCLMTDWDH